MRIIECTAVILSAGLALACAGAPDRERAAVGDGGRVTGRCGDITGWLRDTTAGGRAVHAAPSAESPVLGRIAPPAPEENGEWPVGFSIREARDGWLLVEGAGDDTQLTEGLDRPMYSGRGWIRGNGVLVGIQASQAFAGPSHSSDVVLHAGMHMLDGAGEMTHVVACEGDWVRARWTIREPGTVRYDTAAVVSRNPLVIEAWATGICNILETSCDMPPGDRPSSVPEGSPPGSPPGD